jgi:hypothetical protein
MTSEWQTVSNNKRVHKPSSQAPLINSRNSNGTETPSITSIFNKSNNKSGLFDGQNRNTSDLAISLTKSIIKYTKDQIYSYKQIKKDQQVSYELSNIFDKINDMFKTSTQYIESKKKINYNQSNHNRWELKKDEDNGVINIICSGLNKITKSNMDEILKEIESQEIVLYNDLDKLTEKIIQKCINEVDFVKIYIQVVKHIMVKCKWIVDDNNGIPVTFRRLFMNQLEMRFSNLINDVKNMKYDENESELIVIHSKTRKGVINLVTELYNNKIIGNQLIRYIFKNLEN